MNVKCFDQQVLSSVVGGSLYVKPLQGIIIVSEALQSKSFWLKKDPVSEDSVVQIHIRRKESLKQEESMIHFETLPSESAIPEQQFGDWTKECGENITLCAYFQVYQKLVSVIKQIITADHEGN